MYVFALFDKWFPVGERAVLQSPVDGLYLLDFLVQCCNTPFLVLGDKRCHLFQTRFVRLIFAFCEIAHVLQAWVVSDFCQQEIWRIDELARITLFIAATFADRRGLASFLRFVSFCGHRSMLALGPYLVCFNSEG